MSAKAVADRLAAEPSPVRVNGVAVDIRDAGPSQIRERALSELLRQAAIERGLLASALSEESAPRAFAEAIDRLLEQEVPMRQPCEAECRRYYEANPARFAVGERVQASHILFAVTPGVPVAALRRRAEQALLDVRSEPETFADHARLLSNCPSGQQGGALGWLEAGETVPEFEREVFRHPEIGVLPRLVHTRFGLHVVRVEGREPGKVPAFEEVREAARTALARESHVVAIRHYVDALAGGAVIEGIELRSSGSALVQ